MSLKTYNVIAAYPYSGIGKKKERLKNAIGKKLNYKKNRV